jgi:hypothetical protein
MLELVLDRPDWLNALGVAIASRPGLTATDRRAALPSWHLLLLDSG